MMQISRFQSIGFSILINFIIFSFLPLLHHFFHKPPSEIKSIQIDLIKPKIEKTNKKKKPIPKETKKLIKPKATLRQNLRQRITFELDPDIFASEVDLIAPFVTYDLSEVDQLPMLMEYIKPDYPEEAITKGIEGVVVLKILIDQEGKVAMAKVLNNGGFYEFGSAASRAVKKWRYEPAKIMGMPVAVWCIQSVRFEIGK